MDQAIAIDAFVDARMLKRGDLEVEAGALDYLAHIVSENSDAFCVSWVRDIGTHVEKMANALLSRGSTYYMSLWCGIIRPEVFSHAIFKQRVIELDEVDAFVKMQQHRKANYSLEDFYSDLPLEARVGVSL